MRQRRLLPASHVIGIRRIVTERATHRYRSIATIEISAVAIQVSGSRGVCCDAIHFETRRQVFVGQIMVGVTRQPGAGAVVKNLRHAGSGGASVAHRPRLILLGIRAFIGKSGSIHLPNPGDIHARSHSILLTEGEWREGCGRDRSPRG